MGEIIELVLTTTVASALLMLGLLPLILVVTAFVQFQMSLTDMMAGAYVIVWCCSLLVLMIE